MSEEDVLESLKISRDGIRELIAMQNELLGKKGVQQTKMEWKKAEPLEGVVVRAKALASGKISEALNQKDKHTRIEAVERAKKELAEGLLAEFPDNSKDIHTALGDVEYH